MLIIIAIIITIIIIIIIIIITKKLVSFIRGGIQSLAKYLRRS